MRKLVEATLVSLDGVVGLGSGLRLFEGIDPSPLSLKLTGTNSFRNGIVQLTYVPQYRR